MPYMAGTKRDFSIACYKTSSFDNWECDWPNMRFYVIYGVFAVDVE